MACADAAEMLAPRAPILPSLGDEGFPFQSQRQRDLSLWHRREIALQSGEVDDARRPTFRKSRAADEDHAALHGDICRQRLHGLDVAVVLAKRILERVSAPANNLRPAGLALAAEDEPALEQFSAGASLEL